MKKLALGGFLLLCLVNAAKAATFSFICESKNVEGADKFHGQGVVRVNLDSNVEENNSEALASFSLVNNNLTSDIEDYVAVRGMGSTVSVLDMSLEPFLYTEFEFEADGDLFLARFIFDFPYPMSSRITKISTQKDYKANCRILK